MAGVLLLAGSAAALAQDAVEVAGLLPNPGNTAWMMTATILVLAMTVPGLALFYAGMVRAKNVLSVLMQVLMICAVVMLIWAFYGYTMAFGDGGGSIISGFGKAFLSGVNYDSVVPTFSDEVIPEYVFIAFQMTFACITAALIVGAFAERIKFSALILFVALWVTAVYFPIDHMVWAVGGLMFEWGTLDFAGGTVVHINAGIAALVAAILIGKRKGYPESPIPPHSLTLTVVGASMLWVGWFGFNAGSAVAADGAAGMAMLVTQVATASAAVAWMMVEWLKHGKPSVLGIATGAVAGLVAITPASGSVGPMGAIAVGAASGIMCFWGATSLKHKLGVDDSLDAFGVHGIGGIVGALLTGVFVAEGLGGRGLSEGMTIGGQVWVQLIGVVFTVIYCAVASFIILKIVDATVGLRVTDEEEDRGLDISLHNEQGYYSA